MSRSDVEILTEMRDVRKRNAEQGRDMAANQELLGFPGMAVFSRADADANQSEADALSLALDALRKVEKALAEYDQFSDCAGIMAEILRGAPSSVSQEKTR